MSSKGTQIALTALAVALAVVVSLDRGTPAGRARTSRRIVPEYERSEPTRVVLRREGGEAPVELVRGPGGAYALGSDPAAVLDSVAVEDLLATIEFLSYRQKRELSESADAERGLSPPRLEVALEFAASVEVRLLVGDRIAAIDQVWMRRSDRKSAYLVAGHAARALDRRAHDLRSRRVFRTHASEVTGVEIHAGDRSLVLGGWPLAVHLDDVEGAVRADPAAVAALLRILGDLRILHFARAPEPTPLADLLSVRVIGSGPPAELTELGPCPGAEKQRLVSSPVGVGCVDRTALAAIAGFAGRREGLFDRRLIGEGALAEVAVTHGRERLIFANSKAGWRLGEPGAATEDAAVREWLDAVDHLPDADAHPMVAIDAPGARSLAAIELSFAEGRRESLALFRTSIKGRGPSLVVRRGHEPILWAVGEEARGLFAPAPLGFRPRQLLSLEPYALRSAIARRAGKIAEHVERGELLEEWLARVPAEHRADLRAIARLREAAGRLRAVRFASARPGRGHGLARPRARIEVIFDPPPIGPDSDGGPITHRIDVGASAAEGRSCYALLDDDPTVFEIAREHCDALLGPWTAER